MMIKDQRGSASIFVLVAFIALLATGAMVTDIGFTFYTKIAVKHKLNLALRAAVGIDSLNQAALQDAHNPFIEIDEMKATTKFYEVLKKNLSLDDSLSPLVGSPCDGSVNVIMFKVVNLPDLPYTYSFDGYTETVTKPSVIGIIQFPHSNTFLGQMAGLPPQSLMTVHVTVAPELINKHLEEWR